MERNKLFPLVEIKDDFLQHPCDLDDEGVSMQGVPPGRFGRSLRTAMVLAPALLGITLSLPPT